MENLAKENYDELINYVYNKFGLDSREEAAQMFENTRFLLFGKYDRFVCAMDILTSEYSSAYKKLVIFFIFCSDALRVGQCDGTLAERIESAVRSDKFAKDNDEATIKEIQDIVTECANLVYNSDVFNKAIA